MGVLFGLGPFRDLWRGLARHFHDPRLQQLFGRYATYCGSSPFEAPATLMLVAQVEMDGVWAVEGGMIERVRREQHEAARHPVAGIHHHIAHEPRGVVEIEILYVTDRAVECGEFVTR
jgi:1-hydroxycarotenoid 3,4-desaturase